MKQFVVVLLLVAAFASSTRAHPAQSADLSTPRAFQAAWERATTDSAFTGAMMAQTRLLTVKQTPTTITQTKLLADAETRIPQLKRLTGYAVLLRAYPVANAVVECTLLQPTEEKTLRPAPATPIYLNVRMVTDEELPFTAPPEERERLRQLAWRTIFIPLEDTRSAVGVRLRIISEDGKYHAQMDLLFENAVRDPRLLDG